MLRVQQLLMALPLVLFPLGCTPVGCSGEDPEQDKPTDEQFTGAVEQKLPMPGPGEESLYGTWSGTKMAGSFDMLVLMTNGRYHTAQSVVCVKDPCDPIAQDGPFKLYTRDKRTYIELEKTGAEPARYEYVKSDNTLRLRPLVQGSEWFALTDPGIAWCASVRECKYQNLPPGICSGGYECIQNGCTWKCATAGGPAVTPDPNTGTVNPGDGKTP